jgi:5-methylcytosine-specific restriction endonuclease McrA
MWQRYFPLIMKNLNALACSEIAEFDLIKNSKRRRAALTLLRPGVLNHYNNYQVNFRNIPTIGNTGFTAAENTDLLTCYTSPTNALLTLIGRVTKAQSAEFQYICAYCLYHTVSTVDHYIPKDEYPVFCVMPRNLLPCCANCNSIKNDFWRLGGERLFLHFYNDIVPNLKFLIGTLTLNNNLPIIQYQLVQPATMANNTFALITSHFTRLRLLELYGKGINVVIAEVKKSVNTARVVQPGLSTAQISQVLLTASTNSRISFGLNYWQAVATDLLANSQPFLQTL